MTKNLSDEFLDIYNDLDNYMRKELHVEVYVEHSTLLRRMGEKSRIFSDCFSDLKMFSELRNMIVHNPYRRDADPYIEPHKYVVDRYREIKEMVMHPPKAMSIAVSGNAIFCAKLMDSVQEIMKVMVDKNYTHVPIMEGDKMIGVFSENTLLSYVVGTRDCIITSDATVGDFVGFLAFDKHMNEYFEFLPRNTLVTDVQEVFDAGLKRGKRVAVVYITEKGQAGEKLLGMLTPWDINAKN